MRLICWCGLAACTQGYCSHTLVGKSGLLVPGDPALGVVKFQGRFFVFSSEKAIKEFLSNPFRYTQGAS